MSPAPAPWYIRWAPLPGLVFVLLLLAGAELAANYTFLPGGDELKDFYEDNRLKTLVGLYVLSASAIFLIVYGASLWKSMQDEAGVDRLLPMVVMGGAVAGAVVILGYVGIVGGASDRGTSDDGITAIAAMVTNDAATALMGVAFPGALAALVASVSAATLRSKAFPGWLAWIGVVIAVGMVTPISWAVFMIGLLWVAIVSVLGYRNQTLGG